MTAAGGGRYDQRGQGHGQRMGQVTAQVRQRVQLDPRRKSPAQQARQQLSRRLHAALRPSTLLHQKRPRRGGKFGRHAQVLSEDEPPARHLRPIAYVQVFGQRVALPTAGLGQRAPPPKPRSAVEVEEPPAPVSPDLLDEEVSVQERRLGSGQPRVAGVQMVPAGLRHAHARIVHRRQKLDQELRVGHEVGVQNQHELALGPLEPRRQRPRLEAVPALPAENRDVHARASPPASPAPRQCGRPVGGVVQDLDLQPVAGVG